MTPAISMAPIASTSQTAASTGNHQVDHHDATIVTVRWRMGDGRKLVACVERVAHDSPSRECMSKSANSYSENACGEHYELVLRTELPTASRTEVCSGRPQDRPTIDRIPVTLHRSHTAGGACELRFDTQGIDDGIPLVSLHLAMLNNGDTVVLSDIPAKLGLLGGTYVLDGVTHFDALA